MDERLTLWLDQRATLLASDESDLASLKRHDRQLLGAMEQRVFKSPLTQQQGAGSDQACIEELLSDFGRRVVILEARARLWPGELGRIQGLLVVNTEAHYAAWWLAAHYPALEFPQVFPDGWQSQVWAACALLRRGRGDLLPDPWSSWAALFSGKGTALAVTRRLWAASDGQAWEQWLAPLMLMQGPDNAADLINWLAGHADDGEVIRAMGLSCQGRFLPWLASMRHDSKYTEAALREIRWLVGDQQQRHEGRQCWGEPLQHDVWGKLFRAVPLSFRDRLWHGCRPSTEGSAGSLQGGRWCAGN